MASVEVSARLGGVSGDVDDRLGHLLGRGRDHVRLAGLLLRALERRVCVLLDVHDRGQYPGRCRR